MEKDIQSLMKSIEIDTYSWLKQNNQERSNRFLMSIAFIIALPGLINFILGFFIGPNSFAFLFLVLALTSLSISFREYVPSPSKWFLSLYPKYNRTKKLLESIKSTNKHKVDAEFVANLFSAFDSIEPHIKGHHTQFQINILKNKLIKFSIQEKHDYIYNDLLLDFYDNTLPDIENILCEDIKRQLFMSQLESFSHPKEMNSETIPKIKKDL